MSRSTDPDRFFQTTSVSLLHFNGCITNLHSSDSIATTQRKALKSRNNHGNPIRVGSKILALIADPISVSHVYIAEATGVAKKIGLEVGAVSPDFVSA